MDRRRNREGERKQERGREIEQCEIKEVINTAPWVLSVDVRLEPQTSKEPNMKLPFMSEQYPPQNLCQYQG